MSIEQRMAAKPNEQIFFLAESTAVYDRNTGIQRVVRQLAKSLIEIGFHLIPVKWDADLRTLVQLNDIEKAQLARFSGPKADQWSSWKNPSESPGAWFLLSEIINHWRIADHTSLIQNLRASKIRCAAIFYDAIPWKIKQHYTSDIANAHLRYMIELSFYNKIFPISRSAALDLAKCFSDRYFNRNIAAQSIIPVVLSGEFPDTSRSISVSPGDLRAAKPLTILCVGTLEARKNQDALLEAFKKACEQTVRPVQLFFAGNAASGENAFASKLRSEINKNSAIQWKQNVDDEALQLLFDMCDFSVYPSIEEGFGLPILESLWHGKPVICANFGAMGEAAVGGGCLTVDVRNVSALAEAIKTLIDDPVALAGLRQAAITREFKSWIDYAREIGSYLREEKTV